MWFSRPLILSVMLPMFFAAACGQTDEEALPADASEDALEWQCDTLPEPGRSRCEKANRHRRPPTALVDSVEARLTTHPCVGQLARWQRLYSFGMPDRSLPDAAGVDERMVAFRLREAGVYGFKSERRVTPPLVWVNIDERSYDFVDGSFNVATGEVLIEHCGSKMPISVHQ
jgi:hypothetical protein